MSKKAIYLPKNTIIDDLRTTKIIYLCRHTMALGRQLLLQLNSRLENLDQVIFMGLMLVIRSISRFFLLNTPHHSCIPTKLTWSRLLNLIPLNYNWTTKNISLKVILFHLIIVFSYICKNILMLLFSLIRFLGSDNQ